ncbi:MAG TPA: response regulator, partial [Demequinaceae bacterium]
QLAVTDSGSGMDAEFLFHVFEPFFTTKESGLGTGLGLATIYGIVKQNDGFASVSSEPGVGTTFCIYLPRVDAAPEPSQEPSPEPPAGKANGRGDATILLVEDEPGILALARKALEGQGYVVLPASTGDDALRLAGEHPGTIDLLLTDVIMPEMNGRALADELRSTRPNLKVLFMSGYTADVITGHGTPEGDAHFIAKPFHLKDLAEKVREVLGAASSDTP